MGLKWDLWEWIWGYNGKDPALSSLAGTTLTVAAFTKKSSHFHEHNIYLFNILFTTNPPFKTYPVTPKAANTNIKQNIQ